jgi:Pentapeptide repeats (8 copies)
VDLSGAQLRAVDLSGAQLRGVALNEAVMRGVELVDVDIDGEIENLTINGVDIGPLVSAELDRRYPYRPRMRPVRSGGFPRGLGRRRAALRPNRRTGSPPESRVAACVGRRRVVVHRDAAAPGFRH